MPKIEYDELERMYFERLDELHEQDKRLAELEALTQRQKVNIFKLESIVQEVSIIDEDTGDVYMDGEHRKDLIAVLHSTVILSGEASQDG